MVYLHAIRLIETNSTYPCNPHPSIAFNSKYTLLNDKKRRKPNPSQKGNRKEITTYWSGKIIQTQMENPKSRLRNRCLNDTLRRNVPARPCVLKIESAGNGIDIDNFSREK